MSQFEYKPIYRRNLPHIQPLGATLFVTFRLAGSLPKHVLDEWQSEKQMQSSHSSDKGFNGVGWHRWDLRAFAM
jgi:hypothetical protein